MFRRDYWIYFQVCHRVRRHLRRRLLRLCEKSHHDFTKQHVINLCGVVVASDDSQDDCVYRLGRLWRRLWPLVLELLRRRIAKRRGSLPRFVLLLDFSDYSELLPDRFIGCRRRGVLVLRRRQRFTNVDETGDSRRHGRSRQEANEERGGIQYEQRDEQ